MKNVLDHVNIAPAVLAQWSEICRRTALNARRRGLKIAPGDIADEVAVVLPDGALEIQCDLGPMPLRLRVAPEHWSWMDTPI